jgi:hypothetical protein
MSHLPRNGRYEIFTHGFKTHCFDDPSLNEFRTPKGMFEWIREQDTKYWEPMLDAPESNVALYLQPELYTLWKLKWAK